MPGMFLSHLADTQSPLEDFTGEFLHRRPLFLGYLPQGQKSLLIHFNLKMASLDVHVNLDRFQEFLVIRDTVRVPELRRLFKRLELVREGGNVFVFAWYTQSEAFVFISHGCIRVVPC